MSHLHAPRSRQPINMNGLFPVSSGAPTVVTVTPNDFVAQRMKDGTPLTVQGRPSALPASQVPLVIQKSIPAGPTAQERHQARMAKSLKAVSDYLGS